MRRIAGLSVLVLALCAGVLVWAGAAGGGSGYRVDAIFDNAANLISGQDVKIAGARVGSVVDVRLTPDRRARIQMDIDERFAPFRSDADCTIQPQSLIGEKFIQCTPGTPRGRPLRGRDGEAPTVPLARTHSPVDLDLVFAALRLPYRQRVQVLVNELGVGLAARAGDLNGAIRRANPAIAEANRVLAILDRDRARLTRLVDDSDVLLRELARRRGRVADFVEQAADVTETVAQRRDDLRETIRRLPALLDEARPALDRVRELGEAGTPTLANLRAAAPALTRLMRGLPPLARAGRPALTRLGRMATTGRRTVRVARPVVRRLRTFADRAGPTGRLVAELVRSLRERGGVEGIQTFVYFASAASSRFDRFSHIIPAHLLGSECSQYATEPQPQCDAHFEPGRARARRAARADRAGKAEARARVRPRSPRRTTRAKTRRSPTTTLDDRQLRGLLDYLLR